MLVFIDKRNKEQLIGYQRLHGEKKPGLIVDFERPFFCRVELVSFFVVGWCRRVVLSGAVGWFAGGRGRCGRARAGAMRPFGRPGGDGVSAYELLADDASTVRVEVRCRGGGVVARSLAVAWVVTRLGAV